MRERNNGSVFSVLVAARNFLNDWREAQVLLSGSSRVFQEERSGLIKWRKPPEWVD